jgi:plasmid stabilization system protein ParE
MKLRLRRADQSNADFETLFRWLREQGGTDLAIRFLFSVDNTLEKLAEHPHLGPRLKSRHPRLGDMHSFLVTRPFNHYLVFYRFDEIHLQALRLMHGARDLPKRLLEDSRDE